VQFTCKHILFILACDTYFAFEVLTESVHPSSFGSLPGDYNSLVSVFLDWLPPIHSRINHHSSSSGATTWCN